MHGRLVQFSSFSLIVVSHGARVLAVLDTPPRACCVRVRRERGRVCAPVAATPVWQGYAERVACRQQRRMQRHGVRIPCPD